MANPRRMVSRSLVSTLSSETQERRQAELETHDKPLKRAAMLAVHATATKTPRVAGALVGLRYKAWGAEYIGGGFEFSVFRTGEDEVLKIAHDTVHLPPHQQQAYAERRQAEYTHMASWLGEFVLPQEFSVEPLPFLPSRTAVQVRQPYCGIIDPQLFEPLNPNVIRPNLASLQSEYPSSTDQLSDFIDRSHALHRAQSLLPDTNGPANLVMDASQLRMIDGQPIGNEHFPIQQIILQQLDSLELAIA